MFVFIFPFFFLLFRFSCFSLCYAECACVCVCVFLLATNFFLSSFLLALVTLFHIENTFTHTHNHQYVHTDTSLSFIISCGGIKKNIFFLFCLSFLLACEPILLLLFSSFCECCALLFSFFYIILSALIFFCHSHSHHKFLFSVSFSCRLFYRRHFVEGMLCCAKNKMKKKNPTFPF